MRKEQNMTQWHKYSAETEGESENFVLIFEDGDLQLLVPEAQHIVRVSILYFFITLCNPIPRSLPNVTDTNDAPPLSRALNIHGHRDPGVFHLFTSDHHNSYPWRQMKLQRERSLRLLLVRSRDSGLLLVRTEALPPDLTLHDSPDVIINYWRCAVHHLDTHPLTLWLAHCEAWDTGNWPNAATVHQSESSNHSQQPIRRRQICHPYPVTSQL